MYLNEWIYFRDTNPKQLAKNANVSIENIMYFLTYSKTEPSEYVSNEWERICNTLHITPYQLYCINPLEDCGLTHYTINTSSFKEFIRLQNYFKTKFAEEDIRLWVFDHGRGEYNYQIHYTRRNPLSIEELHQIITTDDYKDFREEHQEPSCYFDEAQIKVIHCEGQGVIT